MDAPLNAVALKGITQEDIDDAIRMVTDHDRAYGVLIEDVEADVVTFRYVMNRPITQGGLRGTRPDSVIDAAMDCDGPCYDDWIVKDELRTCKILRGEHEFFVYAGEEESVTFYA